MATPKLAVAASGYGGRGYADVFNLNQGSHLMGVTTALGAEAKPEIAHWEREQIAAFAVTHLDELQAKDVEVAFRYLQAVPKFLTPKKHDSLDEATIWNAAEYMLNDYAEAGTWIHTYIEDHFNNRFPEAPERSDHYQMVEAFHRWEAEQEIELIATERTVFGDRYAGTADLFIKVNGVVTLVDIKTSRKLRSSHKAQLAALGSAVTTAVEVSEGTPGATEYKLQPTISKEHNGQVKAWFVEEPLPDFQEYAVLQVRPRDADKLGYVIPEFCEMHVIPQNEIDAGFELFCALREVRLAQRNLKLAEKSTEDYMQTIEPF